LVDQQHLQGADFIIDAGTVFGRGGLHRTANRRELRELFTQGGVRVAKARTDHTPAYDI
jgi:hypothetical protein